MAQSDGTSTEYFAYDGLGSVRQVLGESGLPLMAQTFDPYGNPYRYAGPTESATSYGFTGEQTDSNGLVFLRARYYAPSMGRFGQMDPSRQEVNPYLYGLGNPILYTDPSGLCTLGIFGDNCPPENYEALGRAVEVFADLDFWYPEFWGGFATELVNITTFDIPGLALDIYNLAYDAFRGCENNWPALSTLDEMYGPRFQRGRFFGRMIALGLALGEVTVGAGGTGLSILGTPLGGISLLGVLPSLTITAHGAAVIGVVIAAEIHDPLILNRSIWMATSNGSSSHRYVLDEGNQGKHVPGHNNFIQGRSELTHPDPQDLLDRFACTGNSLRPNLNCGDPGFREVVDFGENIGNHVDRVIGMKTPTSIGVIHYSSKGAHIVPVQPSSAPRP